MNLHNCNAWQFVCISNINSYIFLTIKQGLKWSSKSVTANTMKMKQSMNIVADHFHHIWSLFPPWGPLILLPMRRCNQVLHSLKVPALFLWWQKYMTCYACISVFVYWTLSICLCLSVSVSQTHTLIQTTSLLPLVFKISIFYSHILLLPPVPCHLLRASDFQTFLSTFLFLFLFHPFFSPSSLLLILSSSQR